ncbi:MAG: 4-hydroxy-tetrahydrodipicolinate reductase [Gemmatimonadetes bacterium]|nr:4-hydroxy-tetrahydrodipicolinate reductase [Gemmatimonadota bacterium]
MSPGGEREARPSTGAAAAGGAPARRVAIIGDGRMGQAAAQLAITRGWTVTARLGRHENKEGAAISKAGLDHPDVCIEFTQPFAAVHNIRAAVRAGIPIVCGTSGWYDSLPVVREFVEQEKGALFWAANFSVGAHLLNVLAREAGRRLRAHPGFQTHIVETHHAAKKDSPSGTAIVLEQALREGLHKATPITSVRVGSVPGEHTLVIDGAFEQLALRHEARDRRVFAEGALIAADWLVGRTGTFTMTDLLP